MSYVHSGMAFALSLSDLTRFEIWLDLTRLYMWYVWYLHGSQRVQNPPTANCRQPFHIPCFRIEFMMRDGGILPGTKSNIRHGTNSFDLETNNFMSHTWHGIHQTDDTFCFLSNVCLHLIRRQHKLKRRAVAADISTLRVKASLHDNAFIVFSSKQNIPKWKERKLKMVWVFARYLGHHQMLILNDS